MKTPRVLVPLVAAALLIWVTGCEKKEATVQDQAKTMADEASDAAKKGAEAVQETAAKVASDVAEKAKEVAAPASNKAQELIDAASKLVGEGNYQDALAKLKELSGEKLSATQQSLVDALKAQIQKALGGTPPTATDAAGAAGNLLKK
jgi:cell division septum initiation protein DivIVA